MSHHHYWQRLIFIRGAGGNNISSLLCGGASQKNFYLVFPPSFNAEPIHAKNMIPINIQDITQFSFVNTYHLQIQLQNCLQALAYLIATSLLNFLRIHRNMFLLS